MREPRARRGARPCKQIKPPVMRRQWRPSNTHGAELVSERLTDHHSDPSSLRPEPKTTGGLLIDRSFSEEEEDLLIKLHALLGNRWSLIAGRLPGRTDTEVKSHWDSHMRRKLKRMGIDPDNHRVLMAPLASPPDEQRRHAPREHEEDRAEHPGHSSSSKDGDGAVSYAGSSSRAHWLAQLDLELTLSTPCMIYFGEGNSRS